MKFGIVTISNCY